MLAAKTPSDGATLPSALRVSGLSPLLAFPMGTLGALALVFAVFQGNSPNAARRGTSRVGFAVGKHDAAPRPAAPPRRRGTTVSETYPGAPEQPNQPHPQPQPPSTSRPAAARR